MAINSDPQIKAIDNMDDSLAPVAPGWVNVFFWISIVLVVAACAWTVYIALQISSSASQYDTKNLGLPTFEQYAKTAKLQTISSRKIVGVSAEDVTKSASAQQIFEWVADFENGRALERIKKSSPIVSSAITSGIAERSGIRAGDEITAVNGATVRSAFEFYEILDQRPEQTVRVTVKRAGKPFLVTLTAPVGSIINSETCGLLFDVAPGFRHVTKHQTAGLASQFETRFVQLVPPEWRRQYLQNVGRLVLELQPYTEGQRELAASDAGFIRIDSMLSWHHESFIAAIAKYSETIRQANVGQLIALGNLGDAVIGLVSALGLFFLSLWSRSRYTTVLKD